MYQSKGLVHVGVFADWPNASWVPRDSGFGYRIPKSASITKDDFTNNAMRY